MIKVTVLKLGKPRSINITRNNRAFMEHKERQFFSERELTFAYVIARPSVCRLSVTFVRSTQVIEIFGNVSTPFGTLTTR